MNVEKEDTGSARAKAQEDAGSARAKVQEGTGSARVQAQESVGSARAKVQEGAGNVGAQAQEDAGSDRVQAQESVGSARAKVQEGAGSGGAPAQEGAGGACAEMKEGAVALVADYFAQVQQDFCARLEQIDGGRFGEDLWQHAGGGGGCSRILNDGGVFEKAGVNFSHVRGDRLPAAARAGRAELQDGRFEAAGVSAVLHPHNPYVPTAHCNLRFFAVTPAAGKPAWWFGGGFDLTPYYPFMEDVIAWHRAARGTCEAFGADVYPRLKRWCDDYFYLRHRDETRGVGGLFFDDLNRWGFDRCFDFVRAVGGCFIGAYGEIVARRRAIRYGEREREFQLYRRGRYVEFNLVYDRGTLFGLQSGGRSESILMSLPPEVKWRYGWAPEPGTPEHALYRDYLKPRDWLNMEKN